MKRLWLVMLLFFCMAGVVWAAAPNPQIPNLTGGSWRGTIRVYDMTSGTSSIVPIKIAVNGQMGELLIANLTLGTLAIPGNGRIDGSYIYFYGSNSTGYININGNLGYYPYPRIIVTSVSSNSSGTNKSYGDSFLTPNAEP